jgi:hypothetical protein
MLHPVGGWPSGLQHCKHGLPKAERLGVGTHGERLNFVE